jgi:hypothetical protein
MAAVTNQVRRGLIFCVLLMKEKAFLDTDAWRILAVIYAGLPIVTVRRKQ